MKDVYVDSLQKGDIIVTWHEKTAKIVNFVNYPTFRVAVCEPFPNSEENFSAIRISLYPKMIMKVVDSSIS